MTAGRYPASFAVNDVKEDIRLMIDAASRAQFPQVLLRPLCGLYSQAAVTGHGNEDIAAVHTQLAAGPGGS
ncbi:MAG TPA: hypothetical protein VG253_21510 [Streptosporangiaceae bacterium]|jgi:3-hydroxyisobutyrate dehydrogenase-like beta-hydroxyacid dehydrogenase|nr:hypothetical protein [Streptosporangiaceae bacterium]